MREGHRRLMNLSYPLIPLGVGEGVGSSTPSSAPGGGVSGSGGSETGSESMTGGGGGVTATDRTVSGLGNESLMGRFERVLREQLLVTQVVTAPALVPAAASAGGSPGSEPGSQTMDDMMPPFPLEMVQVQDTSVLITTPLDEQGAEMSSSIETAPSFLLPTGLTTSPTSSDVMDLIENNVAPAPATVSTSPGDGGATNDPAAAAAASSLGQLSSHQSPQEMAESFWALSQTMHNLSTSEALQPQQQDTGPTATATATATTSNISIPVMPTSLPGGPHGTSSLSLDSLNFDLIADTIHRAAVTTTIPAVDNASSSGISGNTVDSSVAVETHTNLPSSGPPAVDDDRVPSSTSTDPSSSSSLDLPSSTEPTEPTDAVDPSGASDAPDGTPGVLVCPPGYEPDVFYSLPQDMQQEIVDQHNETADQVRELAEAAGYDYDTVAALPESIRQEILDQARRDRDLARQVAGGGAGATESSGSSAQAQEMDNASFLVSLSPELRAEVLLTADPSFIASLPPELVAEAQMHRERAAAQWQQR